MSNSQVGCPLNDTGMYVPVKIEKLIAKSRTVPAAENQSSESLLKSAAKAHQKEVIANCTKTNSFGFVITLSAYPGLPCEPAAAGAAGVDKPAAVAAAPSAGSDCANEFPACPCSGVYAVPNQTLNFIARYDANERLVAQDVRLMPFGADMETRWGGRFEFDSMNNFKIKDQVIPIVGNVYHAWHDSKKNTWYTLEARSVNFV